jgi:hypothetical protein
MSKDDLRQNLAPHAGVTHVFYCSPSHDYDVVSRLNKLRRAGFNDVVDTEEMLLDQLHRYREARILP